MAPSVANPRLGDWLVHHGHVSPAQLDLALREQKREGKLLGEALLDLGFVTQDILAQFLARKSQTQTIEVRHLSIPRDLLDLIPETTARRLIALPVERDGNELTVAIADPLDVAAFDHLEQTTGLTVRLLAAPAGDLQEAIERLYESRQSVEEIVDELLRLGTDRLAHTTEKDAPAIRLCDRILQEAVQRGASDIHVHPEEKVIRVRFRQDGLLDAGFLVPKPIQPALVARFKILGGMDIAESRRTQDGRGKVVIGGREIGLRFSSLPTSFGESLVLRILDRSNLRLDLGSLGFDPVLEQRFRDLLKLPHGIVLVTGPTGSGKTTTLYSALTQIDGTRHSIFTLEDPVEFQLPLIRQSQINETVGLTFADGLRTLLRQDPDVILVGETRDTETAQLMIRAALTGHLVFSTLHTNDALGAIPRLLDLGVPAYLLAPTLRGILAQRLVRRLCRHCRQPDPEAPQRLASLKTVIPPVADPKPCRPVGCDHCHGSGFSGRVGIHELVVIDADFRSAIAAGESAEILAQYARDRGFRTLLDDGLTKVLRGHTTLEEVIDSTGC
ncbi:MAG: Flp pilus assembly complex ATPase component TadA [Verrucomicrobiales bacterium]|nr:Flp pilus assembly complex ATPase component TadA [Verrucomicrobiales bacterium]